MDSWVRCKAPLPGSNDKVKGKFKTGGKIPYVQSTKNS